MIHKRWSLFVFVLVLALVPSTSFGMDAISPRCDWCVAAGFWENAVRGNDYGLKYVSDALKEAGRRLTNDFRTQIINYCGPKFNDGDVETAFQYRPTGQDPNGSTKVKVFGEAWLSCKRAKKVIIKSEFEMLAREKLDKRGEWELLDIGYKPGVVPVKEKPAKKVKKTKTKELTPPQEPSAPKEPTTPKAQVQPREQAPPSAQVQPPAPPQAPSPPKDGN